MKGWLRRVSSASRLAQGQEHRPGHRRWGRPGPGPQPPTRAGHASLARPATHRQAPVRQARRSGRRRRDESSPPATNQPPPWRLVHLDGHAGIVLPAHRRRTGKPDTTRGRLNALKQRGSCLERSAAWAPGPPGWAAPAPPATRRGRRARRASPCRVSPCCWSKTKLPRL